METRIPEKTGGGLAGLPLSVCVGLRRGLLTVAAGVCLSGAFSAHGQNGYRNPARRAIAQARRAANRPPGYRPPGYRPPAAPSPVPRSNAPVVGVPRSAAGRKAAIDLLKQMVRPTMDYSGEMVTEVMARGGMPLKQSIKGDTNGRTRVEFLTPGKLNGDILIVSPGEVRNYHRSTGVMDVAFWPTEWNDHERRLVGAIRSGLYSAEVSGEETIAGRRASIVRLSANNAGEAGRAQAKFWIDEETGILLKIERADAQGRLISSRTMTSIAVGPAAGVTPQDFTLGLLRPRRVETLFPNPQYRTLQEAPVPFTPAVPASLPPGYHLGGVWVFPANNSLVGQGFVLLRYTDEVSSFSLYEHPGKSAKPDTLPVGPGMFQRPIQRWHVAGTNGDLDVTFIGSLTPQQTQAVRDSLR